MRRFDEPRAMLMKLIGCTVIAGGVAFVGCNSDSTVTSAPLDPQAKEATVKQIQGGQPVSARSGIKVQPKSIKGKVIGKAIQGN